MTHVFVTSCIHAVGEDINEMKDIPLQRDLSCRHFIEKIAPKIGIDREVLDMLGFETKKSFSEDWALRCASSYYQGIPCYYIQWSAIEYVYVDKDDFDSVLRGDKAHARQAKISELSDVLHDLIHERKPANDKAFFELAVEFERANRDALQEFRIPLSAFAQYRCDHSKAFALFDKKNFGKEPEPSVQDRPQPEGRGFN